LPDGGTQAEQPPGPGAERLHSALLGSGLALALVTSKGLGVALALLLLVSLLRLRPRTLAGLQMQDGLFLLLLSAYPLLVAFSMLVHGTQDPGQFDNASRFLLLGIVYIALRSAPFDIRFVVAGAMLGCTLTFCFSAWHLARGGAERFGGFENPVVFAQIAFYQLLVAATPTDLFRTPTARSRLPLVGVILMASVSLVASQSRVGLMALLALCAYLLFRDARRPRSAILRVVAVLVGSGAVILLLNTPQFAHLAQTTAELTANLGAIDERTSMGQRLALWSLSWQMIGEHPLFGHGIGQFREALNSLPDAALFSDTVRAYGHAHNELLQLAVEQGLVGLGMLLLAVAAIALMAKRQNFAPDARYLVVGAILCWLFFGLTHTPLAHQKTTMMFALLLTLGFSHGMNRSLHTRAGID
jgi:O-antigen ligase